MVKVVFWDKDQLCLALSDNALRLAKIRRELADAEAVEDSLREELIRVILEEDA